MLLFLSGDTAIRRVVCLFVRSLAFLGPNVSKTAGDTDSVTVEHLYKIAPGVSNGHVPDDVT